MSCQICGVKDDLFAVATREPACSICVIRFDIGSPISSARIVKIREDLGLKDGQFFQQDRGAEARRILGRYRQGRRR